MQIFGFEILRKKGEKEAPQSVVSPNQPDGSTVVTTGVNAGGYYGMVVDLEGIIKNENDLLRRYREVAQYTDCDGAIEDIVNEAIVAHEFDRPVSIVLDDVKASDKIKSKIYDEFDNIMDILRFEDKGHELFRNWYIDGRLYFHILIDQNNVKNGIVELRYIDPRKIRKIKNVKKRKNEKGVDVVESVEEYYLYNDKGISEQTSSGVKLSLDSVIFCPSGFADANTGMMLSYLHKAIKPVNQLKMIEDALVIYRISRAPERRIFYVDVGNLPKLKAEQYVNDIMNKFRNKIVYDATTGETRDDRRHLSMMEDFWMPRREGGKGTEITTLPGGQNLGQIEDIEYFQKKLYHSLNVPISRLEQAQGFTIGRSTEISRDEVKFNKFIVRLRKKFAQLFKEALKVQLVAKNVLSLEDWEALEQKIRFDYLEDNHFSELKDNEILNQRVQTLQQMEAYIGKYYSMNWVRKNVLNQSDEDIKEIDAEIQQEEELAYTHAATQGTMAGVTQTAQQNYLQQYAPNETEEAPTTDNEGDQ
jgi:hypothetical protein